MISVPVMSLGMRSGVNWMRWKLHVEDFREAAHEHRLRETGHADHEHVPLHRERDEKIADDLLLTDDAFAEFPASRE